MTATKRIPLRERQLPDYTRGEELMNMITHIVGGAVGLLILIGGILIGAKHRDPWAITSGSIYGVLTCTLFVISSVYHGLPDGIGKRVMQVIDHCTIYFMIAGTYTPVLLVGIRKVMPVAAWIVFGVEWGCAMIAATLTAIDLKRYKAFSMVCYLAMGWAIVAILKPTFQVLGKSGFLWLLAGGICYTIGAVLYGLGKKHRYMHSVFHLFVNAGSLLQAIAILLYVL
ncbi:MAG: hemolysin III family protein [Oscillospiraceae bacterium]|jgi:hemolysin III|nr:hemolysin III family protein [Oscillospiraceae bacterium]MBQ5339817.1 hemolysin III family protein [Oscillospiraceae bacterium]